MQRSRIEHVDSRLPLPIVRILRAGTAMVGVIGGALVLGGGAFLVGLGVVAVVARLPLHPAVLLAVWLAALAGAVALPFAVVRLMVLVLDGPVAASRSSSR